MLRRRFLQGTGIFGLGIGASSALFSESGLTVRTHRKRRWICYSLTPSKQKLELFLADASGAPLRTFAALERHLATMQRRLVIGMNAGMFETDGSPVGWCVVEGKTIKPPNLTTGEGNFFLQPNGVFALHSHRAFVRETTLATKTLTQASLITQSGPLLVIGGQLHPRFQEQSPNRLIRNGVGVTIEGEVWLSISEDAVSFHEMATLFRDELGCPDALFLDGVVSQIHAPRLGKKGGPGAMGPILAVTEAAV